MHYLPSLARYLRWHYGRSSRAKTSLECCQTRTDRIGSVIRVTSIISSCLLFFKMECCPRTLPRENLRCRWLENSTKVRRFFHSSTLEATSFTLHLSTYVRRLQADMPSNFLLSGRSQPENNLLLRWECLRALNLFSTTLSDTHGSFQFRSAMKK